jgi:hypothetical protein
MDLVKHTLLDISALAPLEIREAIVAMEARINGDASIALKKDSCPLQHVFAPGVYMRQIHIAAGMMVIGAIHKYAHGNVLAQGKCWVVTEYGGEELCAPLTFTSEPGTKRLVYALTDVVWTTVHATDMTDPEEIERDIIAKDYSEIEILGESRRSQ